MSEFDPPPLQTVDTTEALYSRVLARGRRLRRERRAFLLTAGMSFVLLAAAVPVALTNDKPSQVATTDSPRTTTTRPATTTSLTFDPALDATTTTVDVSALVQGETITTQAAPRATTRTTARRSTAGPTRTTQRSGTATTAKPDTTSPPANKPTTTRPPSTTTTIVPASAPASPCTDSPSVLADHDVAFVRGGDVWVARAAGLIALTTTHDASKPAWSPTGSALVFADGGGLSTVDATGTTRTHLAGTNPGDTDPAWSPDNNRIAFVRNGDIYTIPSAGGGATRVRADQSALGSPTWSPGSCDLAFTWNGRVVKARSADGSGLTNVTDNAAQPSWGKSNKIAIVRASNVWVGNPDGSGFAVLTNTGGSAPSFSGGGDAVAYQSPSGIRTRTLAKAETVVTSEAGDSEPAW
jgi:hypothetical protein